HGAFRHAALRANQVADPRSLLALYVNGEELSLAHGYPPRVFSPPDLRLRFVLSYTPTPLTTDEDMINRVVATLTS
ncbi:hypothetical protein TN53_43130, partial [Streptomyces sp. WM6386]